MRGLMLLVKKLRGFCLMPRGLLLRGLLLGAANFTELAK
jgi:hypothetical protein